MTLFSQKASYVLFFLAFAEKASSDLTCENEEVEDPSGFATEVPQIGAFGSIESIGGKTELTLLVKGEVAEL
jgi:hypothetical protein